MDDHAKNEHAEDWRSHIGEEASSGGRSDDLTRAREPGRGREATTPTDIPASGWKDILWRVLWSIPDDRVLSTSGGVAFFALLAVFPAIATVVSLYGLFADTGTIRGHLSLLAGILPGGVLELIGEQITLIITQDSDTLSLAFVVGSLVALWSANSGVAALFDALNVVYGEKEKRSLLRFYSTTFLLTLGMIALVMAAIGAVVVAPIILTFIGFVTPAEQFVAILRWPVVLVIACAWLAFIYRYGPQPRECQVALGDLGQCHGRDTLAWGVDAVFLVCCQLRQLQQNLWLARCGRRLHGLDLAVGGNRSAWRRAQCRDGAPDGYRQYAGRPPSARVPGRQHGGSRRRVARLRSVPRQRTSLREAGRLLTSTLQSDILGRNAAVRPSPVPS